MLRLARSDDEPFLRRMMYEAASRPDQPRRPIDEVLAEWRNARFVAGWGRPGDLGVIGETDHPVGAAWVRAHAGEEIGPNYAGGAVHQLAIAVEPASRGCGWGRRLLTRLLEEADRDGPAEIQLTVGLANVAAVHLYESAGFETIITDGRSARMRRRR